MIPSISAGWPKRWSGMIGLVRGVMRVSASGTSMLKVSGQEAAKTGVAPTRAIHPAVAKNVNDGQITSSPAPISRATRRSRIPSLPEETPMACGTSTTAARLRSRSSTSRPKMNWPEFSTRSNASFSFGASGAFWSWRSRRGTFIARANYSRIAFHAYRTALRSGSRAHEGERAREHLSYGVRAHHRQAAWFRFGDAVDAARGQGRLQADDRISKRRAAIRLGRDW